MHDRAGTVSTEPAGAIASAREPGGRSGQPPTADWGLPGRRLERMATLYGAALRVGLRYGLVALGKRLRSDEQHARAVARAHSAGARDLHAAAVRLRGGFLKLGQFVSARPDLLPEVYIAELSKLQDRVPPAPGPVIRRVVDTDLGPAAAALVDLELDVASAASLAQVHRARRDDGRPVAVKVQYPNVGEVVPAELRETRRILRLAGRLVPAVPLEPIGDALRQTVLDELDYGKEAANVERFAANFAGEEQIVVPGVHRDLSAGRVLVLDWVDGDNLALALRTAERPVVEEATRLLVDAYLKQILVDGFLHADPHPGNFLLDVTSDGPRLGVVDFGACAALPERVRLALREMYAAGLDADLPRIVAGLDELGLRTRSGDPESLLGWASLFVLSEGADPDARQANFDRLVRAARADPVARIPAELVMLGRVLIVQTGLVGRVDPSWRMDDLVAARLAASADG